MKKLRKLSFRTLAVILSVLMVVYLLPLTVLADVVNNSIEKSGKNSGGSSADYSEPGYRSVDLGNETEADALFEDDNLNIQWLWNAYAEADLCAR